MERKYSVTKARKAYRKSVQMTMHGEFHRKKGDSHLKAFPFYVMLQLIRQEKRPAMSAPT